MQITGSCHCGAIRYEADVDPASAGVCHCTDCQVLSGTAFRFSIRAVPGSFRIVSGAPRVYTKTADSGNLRDQAFCEHCGSPIYAASPGPEPRVYSLRAGTIHQRDQLRPVLQIWTSSQLPWLGEVGALPGAAKQR
ncbi:MAG TPA: GFA family protein [Kofleriaceae bacterium]